MDDETKKITSLLFVATGIAFIGVGSTLNDSFLSALGGYAFGFGASSFACYLQGGDVDE